MNEKKSERKKKKKKKKKKEIRGRHAFIQVKKKWKTCTEANKILS